MELSFFFPSLTLILSVLLTPELGTSHKTVKDITLLKSILNPDIASITAAKLIKLYLPIINCKSASHQSENMLSCAIDTIFWKKTTCDGFITFRYVTRHATTAFSASTSFFSNDNFFHPHSL